MCLSKKYYLIYNDKTLELINKKLKNYKKKISKLKSYLTIAELKEDK